MTDLATHFADRNNDVYTHRFPGGFIQFVKEREYFHLPNVPPPEHRHSIIHGHGVITFPFSELDIGMPRPTGETFGIQRFISAFCGLAAVDSLTGAVGDGVVVVTFQTVGHVFGDPEVN